VKSVEDNVSSQFKAGTGFDVYKTGITCSNFPTRIKYCFGVGLPMD
jgi:predicted small secreted protein